MTEGRQVVLVSGGSRGLGSTIVELLLHDGHTVVTFSRSKTPFITKLQQSDPDGKTFYWESLDGLEFEGLAKLVRKIIRRYGRLDALINNAGTLAEGLLALTGSDDIHRVIALNMESTIHLTRAVSRVMIQKRFGSIINISSLNGIRGYRGVSVYAATKAGLDGFTRSLARELGPAGIRVNSLAPGYFKSEMAGDFAGAHEKTVKRRTPLGRLGEAEDMAKVVRFLISGDAGFLTGQTIVVDGGYTC